MQNITLTVAIVVCLLAIVLRPPYALAAYIIALLWYPNYLVVSIGTIDISVGRFVIGILALRCLCDIRARSRFTWSRLDTRVVLSMVVYVGTYCINEPLSSAVENRGGFLMDTLFAYIVCRFIVTDRKTLVTIVKCVAVALVPLAILGMIESTTGWQPFIPLMRYCPWYGDNVGQNQNLELRWGFARAAGPFNHSILFGCCFALFLSLIYYLRHEKNYWQILAYILSAMALIGSLCSMSMGPWVMVASVIFCLAVERHERWVKPLLIFFAFSCVFVEITSNRHFYHVFCSYVNLLGGSGYHRATLVDLAIKHFGEWWLFGYGDRDPGWGPYLGMTHTDLTNEFILAGVRYGALGIIVICGVLITAFRNLVCVYKKSVDPQLKSLCWALGSGLVGVIAAWMSVSFFGQLVPLFYCTLGIIGSLYYFVSNREQSNPKDYLTCIHLT